MNVCTKKTLAVTSRALKNKYFSLAEQVKLAALRILTTKNINSRSHEARKKPLKIICAEVQRRIQTLTYSYSKVIEKYKFSTWSQSNCDMHSKVDFQT